MKKTTTTLFLLIFISAVLLSMFSSCASMKLVNYHFQGEETIVDTDFGEIPSPVKGVGGNVTHEDGTIHSRAPKGEATSWYVDTPISRKSRISFRMKLGEQINGENHPAVHINMLQQVDPVHQRIVVMMDEKWGVGYFWNGENKDGDGHISEKNLELERWYRIDLVLNESTILIFVDGSRLGSAPLNSDLPGWGTFVMECHNEIWIDDLRIVNYGSYQIEKK